MGRPQSGSTCSSAQSCPLPAESYLPNGVPVAATAGLPQHKRDSSAEAHCRAIPKTLERRLQVAGSQGNGNLISLLEEEWQQFAEDWITET